MHASAPHRSQAPRLPFLGPLLRAMVRTGHLSLIDAAGGRHEFSGRSLGPSVTVRLHDRQLPLRLVLNPSLAFGEAYMDGLLTIEEGTLRELLDLVMQGLPGLDSHPIQRLRANVARKHRIRNHRRRAKANVAHHYDLSDSLYEMFLDTDRQYSCAYFRDGDETLEAAQVAKKQHIAAKLLLRPGQKVLDIGSGWGGLALDLARAGGVDVTGITLSDQQLAVSRLRAESEGLSSRVRFEHLDYRAVRENFDRIVSVGMFEHVGPADFSAFFQTVARALKPDGVALIHSIGRMEPPGSADPWISKYIFPGGYIPALSEVVAAVEKTGLWITDIEILRLHYAETLRHWNERFQVQRSQAARIYDERFCRMWEFYLTASEMLFRNGPLMVFQLQLAHRNDAVPLTRDYITDNEGRLAVETDMRCRGRA